MPTTDNISMLEYQLKEAKRIEAQKKVEAELTKAKVCIGQITSSHTMQFMRRLVTAGGERKQAKSRQISIVHIKDVGWGLPYSSNVITNVKDIDDKHLAQDYGVIYLVDTILITQTEGGDIQIYRNMNKWDHNATRSYRRHKLSKQQFDQLVNSVDRGITNIFEDAGKIMPALKEECSFENRDITRLEKIGCKFIDVSMSDQYTLMNRIPFVWNGKLWACNETLQLLDEWSRELGDEISNTTSFSYGHEYIPAYKMCEPVVKQKDMIDSLIHRVNNILSEKAIQEKY